MTIFETAMNFCAAGEGGWFNRNAMPRILGHGGFNVKNLTFRCAFSFSMIFDKMLSPNPSSTIAIVVLSSVA